MAGGWVTGGAGGSVCCVCEGWVGVSGGVGWGVVVGAGFVGADLVEAVVGAAEPVGAGVGARVGCAGSVAGTPVYAVEGIV